VNGDRPSHTIYLETETAAIPRPNSLLGVSSGAAKPSPYHCRLQAREYNGFRKSPPRPPKLMFVDYTVQHLSFFVRLREPCPQTPLLVITCGRKCLTYALWAS
jgi:hypothetical protein